MRILLLLCLCASQLFGAWGYRRAVVLTSNTTLLPATLANFPMLVKLDATNAGTTLKSTANGGHIQHGACTQASGPAVTMPCDLIFASDLAGSTKVPWEVESYDATSGVLWAWVLCVSCAPGTTLYALYGDAAVTTVQNTGSFVPANVWDSNYMGVWHLSNSTVVDSTGLNTTTNHSTSATAGLVDGGALFNGSTGWIQSPSSSNFDTPLGTWEVWSKSAAAGPFLSRADNTSHHGIVFEGHYVTIRDSGGSVVSLSGTTSLPVSTWAHTAVTFGQANGSAVTLYLNGATNGTANTSAAWTFNNTDFEIGISDDSFWGATNGSMDEVRISNIVRSADWIRAEYNSENDPQTFAAVGTESPMSVVRVRRMVVIL